MQQLVTPLRTCRVCGLHVYTEADLALFKKHKASRYERENLCWRCFTKYTGQRVHRTAEFVKIFRARSSDGVIRCCFCDEEVTKLKGRDSDSLNIHSLDDNHENWMPDNKAPSHNVCHIQYHWNRRASLTKALRTCRVCGLEAHTEEDLNFFVKASKSHSRHGRQNRCKPCANLARKDWRTAQRRPKETEG